MKHLCHYIFILLSAFLFAACGKKTDAVQFQADADSLVEAKMQEAISLQEKNEQLTSELSREDSLLARFEVSSSASDKSKQNPTTEESTDTVPKLTPQQVDSVVFRLTHHYGPNFNFELKADSMILVPREGDLIQDTCVVRNKDLLVVAQIKRIEASDSTMEDTFLIKVAHDQTTMGWVKESELLENAVPDDPISQLIDFMTGSRAIWMSSFLGFGVIAFFFRKMRKQKMSISLSDLKVVDLIEMDSFYPPLLLILVACVATLYASVQNFVPEFWQEYYFHPTMNPLLLPPIMAVLVTLVWLTLIVIVAVVIEVYNNFYSFRGIIYLFEIAGLCMLVYLLISWTILIYVGYLLLPILIAYLIYYYFKYIRCTMTCGHCGRKIREKGICKHCGAINE
ncbi:MAG: zinc ribbon domain-containing protein [Bacteroidaceae bacterium]|nr:zinc ribbon domain-containing protein [Bacteroidaceae bacterium]